MHHLRSLQGIVLLMLPIMLDLMPVRGAMKTTLKYGPERMNKGLPWERDKFFEKD